MISAPTLAVLTSTSPTRDELRARIEAVDFQLNEHAVQMGKFDGDLDRAGRAVAETYAQLVRHHGNPSTWESTRSRWLDTLSAQAEVAREAVVAGELETRRLQKERAALRQRMRELDVADLPPLCDFEDVCLHDALPGSNRCEEHSQLALEGLS